METIFLCSLIIAGFILVTFACIKWETARWLTGAGVTVFVVIVGVISAFRINAYYNTKGGIIGYLNGIIHPNQVEITAETLTFDFSNVALLQEDDDTYVAKIEEPLILELEEDEKYGVFVNGALCDYLVHEKNNLSQSTDYVQVVYDHAFYDKDITLLMRDKLKLSFAFYKNSSQIIVETSGGSDAVKLWNAYFTKNNFKVEIKPVQEIYYSNADILILFNNYSELELIQYIDAEFGNIPVQSNFEEYYSNLTFDAWLVNISTKLGLNTTEKTIEEIKLAYNAAFELPEETTLTNYEFLQNFAIYALKK